MNETRAIIKPGYTHAFCKRDLVIFDSFWRILYQNGDLTAVVISDPVEV
jgi:hypothetical protein